MFNLIVVTGRKPLLPVLLLLLLFGTRETATYPRQYQHQPQQQAQQPQPYAQRLLSVNEKQVRAITDYMNRSADPCSDFFAYACGNWPLHHNTTRYTEVTGFIDHKINKKLVLLLEEYGTTGRSSETDWSQIDERVLRKAWTYYRACKRERSLQLRRYLELVRPAERLNWPVLHAAGAWPKERFSWWLTLGKLRRYGFKGTMLEHLVLAKVDNGDEYVVDLDQANSKSRLPRRSEVVQILVSLGLREKEAVEQYVRMKQLEKRIRELLIAGDGENEVFEVSVRELGHEMPKLAWRKYLTTVLGNYYELDDSFTIQIRNWEYFKELAQLLDRTEPEVTCNYIMVMFLVHLINDSTSTFDKIDCVVDLRSKMDLALSYIYRQRFYKPEAGVYERESRELLQQLRGRFEEMLESNRLAFEPEEIDFLKEKLRAVRINFGNLPLAEDDDDDGKEEEEEVSDYVADYYKDLDLDERNYYKNHLALLELRSEKEHRQLERRSSNYVFIADSDTARSSTPYYLMRKNVIIVPFGNFQPPMYHKNMHDLLKFSLFGFLLAHELVHGFDASGIIFDSRGNLQELGLKMSENANFSEVVECLQREETENIDERIADIVGVRLAYNTYFGRRSANPADKVPFAEFSLKRLFFLNMAQFFCGSEDAGFVDHDSDYIRLQQTLLNFEPFADEFGCVPGDVMHPEQKCRLY